MLIFDSILSGGTLGERMIERPFAQLRPNNVLVFHSSTFTNGLFLIIPSVKILLHEFHFQEVEEFVFRNSSRLLLLYGESGC